MIKSILKSLLYNTIINYSQKYGIVTSTILFSILFYFSPSYFLFGALAYYL